MRIRLAVVCLLSVSTLALTGCISGFDYTPGTHAASFLFTQAAPTVTPPSGIVSSYPTGSTGVSVAATSSASLSANYLGFGVRGDGAGHIYSIGNLQGACCSLMVNVYSTANGVLTLTRSFTYTSGVSVFPQSFAADPTGIVYVSDSDNDVLLKFAANATGAATPTIISTGTYFTPMATDSAGDLYAYAGSGTIYVYPAGLTAGTPVRILSFANIPLNISDMAVDSIGNIYITGYDSTSTPYISAYSSTPGTFFPFKTISGPATLMAHPVAIAVDALGNIYEEDAPTALITAHANTIYTFPATASGNATPISQFSPATLTQAPATFVGLVAY